jgi:hypothetical protein
MVSTKFNEGDIVYYVCSSTGRHIHGRVVSRDIAEQRSRGLRYQDVLVWANWEMVSGSMIYKNIVGYMLERDCYPHIIAKEVRRSSHLPEWL